MKGNSFRFISRTISKPSTTIRAIIKEDQYNSNRITRTRQKGESILYNSLTFQSILANKKWQIQKNYADYNKATLIESIRRGDKIILLSNGSYHLEIQTRVLAEHITMNNNPSRFIFRDNMILGKKQS